MFCNVFCTSWFYSYRSELFYWYWGKRTVALVPVDRSWWIWGKCVCRWVLNGQLLDCRSSIGYLSFAMPLYDVPGVIEMMPPHPMWYIMLTIFSQLLIGYHQPVYWCIQKNLMTSRTNVKVTAGIMSTDWNDVGCPQLWVISNCLEYHHSLAVPVMTSSNGNIFRVTGHCAGNSLVPGEFPAQRPVTRSFDVFF